MGVKGGNLEEDSNKDSRPSEEVELSLNNSKRDTDTANMEELPKDEKMVLDHTESEEKQEKDKTDRETVKETNQTKESHNPANGDIETKFVLDNKHLHAALSIPGSRSSTPNTARKRKNRHLEEMNMAEMISLSGMESLCTVSNYDAMSTRDLDDDEEGGEEEEEEVEKGIGVHHVLSVLLAMMSVAIVLLLYFLVPCPMEPANWSVEMEGIASSSPVRLLDVNRDGMDDAIFGFSVGKSTDPPEVVEQLCENLNMSSCGGGVLAMSGWRGEVLWRLDLNHTQINGLVCNQLDVNGDGQLDCLATGSDGLLMAINTKTGDILWTGDPSITVPNWTYSQPQTLPRDLDDDDVLDLVVSHGVSSESASDGLQHEDEIGRLLLLSGKTGQALGTHLEMPDGQASVSPPLVFQASDDEDETPYVVFGSGAVSGLETTNPGSMWMVSLDRLYCHVTGSDCIANTPSGDQHQAKKRGASTIGDHVVELIRGREDGFVLPAIVADLTMDEVNDLIVVSLDAIVTVINGSSFKPLWSRQINVNSKYRPYSVAAPGHFNHDEVPDIMIQLGLSEPSSDTYNKMVILDGLTGEELWHTVTGSSFENQPISIPSPLSLRAEEEKDAFLFWLEHFPVTEDGTTTQSNVERCSDLISTYPTLSLVMMDRDMAMDPPSLVSFKPYKPITTVPTNQPSGDMSTGQPMTTGSAGHMTSAASGPSSTVVVDITPVVGGDPTPVSNASSPPPTSTLSSSSSTSSHGRERRSSSEDCYMMEPVPTDTGIVGDFDDDGSLEVIVAVNMLPTYLGSSSNPLSSEPRSRLTIQRVSVERGLDQNNRVKLIQADSFLNPSVENSTVSGNIFDHFDLLQTKSQTWLGYLGTKADGRYT